MRYADADTGKAHVFCKPVSNKYYGASQEKVENNTWANRMYALLRKDQPKWAGFDMRPKGEVS